MDNVCPNYLHGYKALFEVMKKQKKKLILAEGNELPELAILFNETTSTNDFMEKLEQAFVENRIEFNKYNETINKQSLE